LQLERIATDHVGTREAGELDVRVVDVDETERRVLQRRREWRIPEELQRLANARLRWLHRSLLAPPGRALHSSDAAPCRVRSWARLISATLISKCSAASR